MLERTSVLKEHSERILILCVDRDNDLGEKTGLKSPILGRAENLNAATTLIIKDPEEADANAMFEAIRIFDRYRDNPNNNEEYMIATITGAEKSGVGADRKLSSELMEVLNVFPADGVILVTDGFTDEDAILPLVQSRVPVNSVRRIAIKHSETIEETAAVFSRYLNVLMEKPQYSRIVFGLPGIMIIVFAILYSLELIHLAWSALFIIIGLFLFVKGFGLEDRVTTLFNYFRSLYERIKKYSPPPLPRQLTGFSTTAGILLMIIGCFQAGAYIMNYLSALDPAQANANQWFTLFPTLIGLFISNSITLLVIGVSVLLSGVVIRSFMERDSKFWGTLVIMIVSLWSQQIFLETSKILIDPSSSYMGLVVSILIGISLTAVSAIIAFKLRRRFSKFFGDHH